MDSVLGWLLALILGALHAIFTSDIFWIMVAVACISLWISWVVRDAVKDAIADLHLDERVREAVQEAMEEEAEDD
jgi:divalent metal cation (Fe/Co/Zn/Cd) transporter